MAGLDNRDPLDDYENLREELRLYDPSLAKKPFIVAGNKMDEAVAAENLRRFRERFSVPVLPISCLSDEGIDTLKAELYKLLRKESDVRPCSAGAAASES